MTTKDNGRVQLLYDANYDSYKLFKEEPKDYRNFAGEAIKSIHAKNDLALIFFSTTNVDVLQQAIQGLVYEKSCHKYSIGRQSDNELRIIMRSIYLEKGIHTAYKNGVLDEVKRLNQLVLEFCVPRIMQEIKLYMQYKADVDSLPMPLDRGEFSSSKGTKTLILKDL
jgi:hypothetical protein